MKDYQKLLDNGWAIQLHKSSENAQYIAVGISRPLQQTILDIMNGEEDMEALNPPFSSGTSPEDALFCLTEKVLFGR